MLSRARFLILYALFWVVFFECARILFFVYQRRHAAELELTLAGGALLHGLTLDISAACIISLIPLCVVARVGFMQSSAARRILLGYTAALLIFAGLALVADLEVFRMWGYRLDGAALGYLRHPREAFASASASPLLFLTAIWIGIAVSAVFGFKRMLLNSIARFAPVTQPQSLLFLLICLIPLNIGGRGGFRWRMILTPGSVYFSSNNFANQAAVNPVWNFVASVISSDRSVEEYAPPGVVKAIVDSLLARPAESGRTLEAPSLLRQRPRSIVLLFWEGLTVKIVEPMGGIRGITPHFSRLVREGILFDGLYASGPRTSNGLVAVLSGLPSHPTWNPLESAERVAALPSLSGSLAAAGYRTGFYYGAPLEFDDRNRYLLYGHYDEIVEKKDFNSSLWASPWGVHDPHTLDRLFRAVDSATQPIFAVTLTLSSHEPFEVPPPARISGKDGEHKFLNSQVYTDKAVSEFVERLRRSRKWDTTLLIIVADHGSQYPALNIPLAGAPAHYRIPMLWLGGSLAVRDTVIGSVGTQHDVPNTLLRQLRISNSEYKWGKDLLALNAPSFAFYSFENGFGYVDGSGSYVFDNVAEAIIYSTGKPPVASIRAGRAFQQAVMQEYIDLALRASLAASRQAQDSPR